MSVVNRKNKHIFVHVPKTAGTSMERTPFVGGNGHESARSIRDRLGEEEFRSFFSWGFVRNPFDRLVSVFHAIHQHPDQCGVRDEVTVDFTKFIQNVPKLSFTHVRSMSYYLCDPEGKVLVDFVGRYETLQQDWDFVCTRLRQAAVLGHKNKTEHDNFWSYYDEEALQIVSEHYRSDFENFGYSSVLSGSER